MLRSVRKRLERSRTIVVLERAAPSVSTAIPAAEGERTDPDDSRFRRFVSLPGLSESRRKPGSISRRLGRRRWPI